MLIKSSGYYSSFNWRLLLKTRLFLFLGLSLFFSSLFILLLFAIPQTMSAISQWQDISVLQSKIQKLQQKDRELSEINNIPEYVQASMVNQILPGSKPLIEVINQLNQLSLQAQVSITDIKTNPGDLATSSATLDKVQSTKDIKINKSHKYQSLEFHLKAKGYLTNLQKFLSMVEQMAPITNITSISLKKSRQSEVSANNSLIEAEITIQSFYFSGLVSTQLEESLPTISKSDGEIFQTIVNYIPNNYTPPTEVVVQNNDDPFGVEKTR